MSAVRIRPRRPSHNLLIFQEVIFFPLKSARAAELIERRDAITAQLREHTNTRVQLEAAYQQICGAIAVLEELVPSDDVIEPSPNGEVIEEEEVVADL